MDYSPPGSSVPGIPRQVYWNGSLFPSPGDLPNPGIKPVSLALAGGFYTAEPSGKSSLVPERFICIAEVSFVLTSSNSCHRLS